MPTYKENNEVYSRPIAALVLFVVIMVLIIVWIIPQTTYKYSDNEFESIPLSRGLNFEDIFSLTDGFSDSWIPNHDYPSDPCSSSPLDSGCKSVNALREFYVDTSLSTGVGFKEVHQYRNHKEAIDDFDRFANHNFGGNDYTSDWYYPDEFDTISLQADKYRLGCQTRDYDNEYCQLIAHYEEFIIILLVDVLDQDNGIEPDYLNYSDIVEIFERNDMLFINMLQQWPLPDEE